MDTFRSNYIKKGWITRKKNGKATAWNKGIPHTLETRAKIKEKRKSQVFSEKTKKIWSEQRKGRVVSEETRQKKREALKGENCYAWKGGITSLYKAIRDSFQYRQWRSDVFSRDDFRCQECDTRGGQLQADHIKSFALIIEQNNIKTVEGALLCAELWNINNGRTLCKPCHLVTETWGQKSRILVNNYKQTKTGKNIGRPV